MNLGVEEGDQRTHDVHAGVSTALAKVHGFQRHEGGFHLRQPLLDVAVVLRTACQRVGFHTNRFCLGQGLHPTRLTIVDLAQDGGKVFCCASELLAAYDATTLKRFFGRFANLLQRAHHRGEVSASQQRCSNRVTEQLTCSVQGRSCHRLAQQARRNRHGTPDEWHLRWDTLHAFDQQVAGNFLGACDISVAVLAVDFELDHIRAFCLANNLGHVKVNQLKDGVLGGKVAQTHVCQHVGVLNGADHEVHDGLVAANQLVQVWLLGNAADANRCCVANQQLSRAVALTIERDVVVLAGQFCANLLGQGAGVHHKINHVAVVGVVLIACQLKDFLQGWVALNFPAHTIQVSLSGLAAKVQLVETNTLTADGRQVHREHAVDGFAVTNERLGALQNIHHALDTRPFFALDDELFFAVSAFFLGNAQGAVAHGLRYKVHALIVHAQVVHHLATLERLHDF